jgi:uncharacterized radical SAM protein YgiQ
MSREEMERAGWRQCDFVLVSGDAYVDHPSFGAAVIFRVLEEEGFRVGVIAQPDWRDPASLRIFGAPKYAFLVTAGNMDSMVAGYTAAGRRRSEDAYSPGGRAGLRPDRAALVYANLARAACKGTKVILGGIEASLRRLSHYDYWSNTLRASLLLDAKADLLVYGMGETPVREIARRLASGEDIAEITDVRGTVYPAGAGGIPAEAEELPAFEELQESGRSFAESFRRRMRNADPYTARPLAERFGGRAAVQNPPAFPLTGEALDRVYELPYSRAPHPVYEQTIPAFDEVRFSLIANRGCYGGCSFCAIAFHQGRIATGRTQESLVREAARLTEEPGFKGNIHDVGGPTANFRRPACRRQSEQGACTERECLYPEPCPALDADHGEYLQLLRRLREVPGVKRVFIRSGIRYDVLLAGDNREFLRELCAHHVSGQLKVAPEHVADRTLAAMGKPGIEVYRGFKRRFMEESRRQGRRQYLIPYLISSHPGTTLRDAVELAEFLRDEGFIPRQVQEFYPTPGTAATCMYYTGVDPRTMQAVYVPWRGRERRLQRALMQFDRPENRELVREALKKAGRTDLIGSGPGTLVRNGSSRRKRGSNRRGKPGKKRKKD